MMDRIETIYGSKKMMDRIGTIYMSIDEMFKAHGIERPERFGKKGDLWNVEEELVIWKKQIIDGEKDILNPLTNLQWGIINNYINVKRKELEKKSGVKTK